MYKLGTVVSLKVPVLGNETGALGICFEEYDLGGHKGCEFIFENGEYDGFDKEEQANFLQFIRHREDFEYEFKNVMKLSEDFNSGYFTPFIGLKGCHTRQYPDWKITQ